MIVPLILAAALGHAGFEIWTAGDDALTQRFAAEFRAAVASSALQAAHPGFRATVSQIVPQGGDKYLSVVILSRGDKQMAESRCVTADDENELRDCARRAADVFRPLFEAGR